MYSDIKFGKHDQPTFPLFVFKKSHFYDVRQSKLWPSDRPLPRSPARVDR